MDRSTATGITNYINDNGIGNNPTDAAFSAASSTKLYRLNSNSAKTGLGITLKVMAGDKIDVLGKSYYFQNTAGSGGNSTLPITDLLTAFLSAPAAAATTAVHGLVTAAGINTASGIAGINTMIKAQDAQSNENTTKPRAFINVLFFDEQFKAGDSRVSMVGSNSIVKDHYTDLQNIVVPKNGYVYIYCSNESPVNVFFDNMQVVQTRGAILEETHYYPFGLTMAGISSKAAGKLENKYKYNKGSELQSKEFSDGSGLEMYDTHFRQLDPQIGRWWQIDPKPNESESPYAAMGNNPTSFNDPLGDTLEYPNASKKFMQTAGTTIVNIVNKGQGKNLGFLLNSKAKIKIIEIKNGAVSNYNTQTKTLSWNPKQGVVTTNGTKLSPASILNHESDHAADDIKDPVGHEARRNKSDPDYGNKEEKRVETSSEQTTALGLGEIKEGQVTRTDHNLSGTFETNDPMSIDGNIIYFPSVGLPDIIIKSSKKPH